MKYLLYLHNTQDQSKNCDIESGFSDLTLSESYQLHREIEQQHSSEFFDTVEDPECEKLSRYGSMDSSLQS